jgi:hypothetical protein
VIVESRIESVTVYHRGATVRRRIELTCSDEGPPSEITVIQLPLALIDPTVRVRVIDCEPKAAQVVATDVRVGLYAEPRAGGETTAERAELEQLEREMQRKSQLLSQLEAERNALVAMEVPARPLGEEGKPPPASPLAARVAIDQFCDEAITARMDDLHALRVALRALERKATALRELLQRQSSAREVKPHELCKTVTARLFKRGEAVASKLTLGVDYHVPGARWAPAYQCRLTRDCSRAEIQLRALISQRSGEDWRGVKLALSTAAPLSWTELPTLSSVRIGRAQPTADGKRGFRPPPRGASALFADFDYGQQQAQFLLPRAAGFVAPSFPAAAPDLELSQAAEDEFAASVTPADAAEVSRTLDEVAAYAAEELDDYPDEESFSLGAAQPPYASAPPPPPAVPAAPAPAGPTAIMKRRAPNVPKRSAARSMIRDVGHAMMHDTMRAEPAADAAASALLYHQLRLGEPESSDRRGRLLPVDRRSQYLNGLSGHEVHIDVLDVVRRAEQQAADLLSTPLPEGAQDVRRNAGRFDYVYPADAPVDIESDGVFHSVALGVREAPSSVSYVIVPREDTGAYRVARLENPLFSPLLPGPAEVYVGGEYVLTTALPLVGRQGQFQLGLGVEQAIKVARNTHFEELRSGSKVVAMSELSHRISIELQNHLQRSVACEVRERLPFPAENAEVVVEEDAVDPPWEPYTQTERGHELKAGRRWKVELGAGEKLTLNAAYVVKIYANNELVGGNRREA